MEVQDVLNSIIALFKREMSDKLVGIYVHGSLAMGCFNPYKSDIDLLVVIDTRLTQDHCKAIAKGLLAIHAGMANTRGVELTIVLDENLQNLCYPTPIEFHYSDFHREKYEKDEHYVCGGVNDPDLAAQLVIAYHRGIRLFGKPLREVIPPVDRQLYLKAILYDIEDAAQHIQNSAMYYTLNLCRVLFYLREGGIASKREGGEWGLNNLPTEFRELVQHSLDEYSEATVPTALYKSQYLALFVQYMQEEIYKLAKESESGSARTSI
ncbi:DUF4111 domain-containing protein [Paenibacillus oenotherae]|uniref:Spectinomycin 9-adenylyltransferase n=1 Tax=Paenibacillus oenotherae TaxID=1435645 RepID=A0ABS7D069_9BACL|nr:aminoglycoside adenylyltransferase domain-containing protein [Paenibacillus oenotherae]MBW7473214.1 DUF4111 domain-containing protein [Paenibacillus oenotherae]